MCNKGLATTQLAMNILRASLCACFVATALRHNHGGSTKHMQHTTHTITLMANAQRMPLVAAKHFMQPGVSCESSSLE
jgi:hypothetical protein